MKLANPFIAHVNSGPGVRPSTIKKIVITSVGKISARGAFWGNDSGFLSPKKIFPKKRKA